MNRYQVEVVMSYWQTIEVEAESDQEARDKAFDLFDIASARPGEGETYDVKLIEGEKK